MMGAGSAVAGAWASGASARTSVVDSQGPTEVGSLALQDVEIIDTHLHVRSLMTVSQRYSGNSKAFTHYMMPRENFEGKDALRSRWESAFDDLVWNAPRTAGFLNFMARRHGVPATIEGADSVISKYLKSAAEARKYVEALAEREKIAAVVIQATGLSGPVRPRTVWPENRFVWTYPISPLLAITWARSQNASTMQDVLAAIDNLLETAVDNGCRGFKNFSAYQRSYNLGKVSVAQAENAFRRLLAARSVGTDRNGRSIYENDEDRIALRRYEDFLLRHIYVKAGLLECPIIIHSAVAFAPSLRTDFNDPAQLYDVLMDDRIIRAFTNFVIIHTGYPSHHIVASLISQFPQVYVDTSFFSRYPGTLDETYRALLALAPSGKVMHGSDGGQIPDEAAYCAWNTRVVLAHILNDYKRLYGWTQSDVESIAEDVLHRNARKVFRIEH